MMYTSVMSTDWHGDRGPGSGKGVRVGNYSSPQYRWAPPQVAAAPQYVRNQTQGLCVLATGAAVGGAVEDNEMLTFQPEAQSVDFSGSSNRPAFQPVEARPRCSLADCLPVTTVRTLRAQQHLFREGDEKSNVYQILDGTFVLYRLLPNGRRQVTGFAVSGDIVGLGTGKHHLFSAESSSQAQVRALPTIVLHRLAAEDSKLGLMLYDAMSRELLTAQDHLAMVSMLYAVERVAMFLVGLSNRRLDATHLTGYIEFPMTRYDIADFLSLTTETVSRSLTKLVNSKVIARQPRGIRVLDRVSLLDMAKGEFTS